MSTYRRDSLFCLGFRFHSGGNSKAVEAYCWEQRQQRANGLQTNLQKHTLPSMLHLLNLCRHCHHLGIKYSKVQEHGGTYSNYHKKIIATSAVLPTSCLLICCCPHCCGWNNLTSIFRLNTQNSTFAFTSYWKQESFQMLRDFLGNKWVENTNSVYMHRQGYGS